VPYRLSLASALAIAAVAVAQKRPVELPPIYVTPSMPAAFRLLTAPAVQKDVGLTPAQLETVETLTAEWATPTDTWSLRGVGWLTPVQARAETARRTDAFLTRTLTKEQARRVNQIAYQLREKELGAHTMFVASAGTLGLRDDQTEDLPSIQQARVEEITKLVLSGDRFAKVQPKVTASNADSYEKMAEMLTRTQREKLKELRGKQFTGELDSAFFSVPASAVPKVKRSAYPPESFGTYDYEVYYLANARVGKELKGTEDQIQGWTKVVAQQSGLPDSFKTWTILKEHLTPAQLKRFHELMIQRRLVLGGVEATLGYPLVVDRLKLTGSQLESLRTGAAATDILTAEQEKERAALAGEPFNFLFDVDTPDPVLDAYRKARAEGQVKRNLVRPEQFEPNTLARSLLLLSGRLELSADQIKQLREIAGDEPKMKALIDRELGFPDGQHTIGADRGLRTATAVQSKYQRVVEEQSWKVLDPKQQSRAKQMMGRGK
jgi:hypothetical protein